MGVEKSPEMDLNTVGKFRVQEECHCISAEDRQMDSSETEIRMKKGEPS
jgi:hypothetical protein